MKKFLAILVLGLLWCNVGVAQCIKGDCNNGQGTWVFKSGDKYIGEHKNARGNGQGTYIFVSGNKYVGEFKDDKYHGQGTFTFASGEKYVGEYKDGKKNGQGIYTWEDGGKYVGEFKNDQRSGQGIHTYVDGTIENGIFENGRLIEKQQVAKVKKTKQELEKKIIKSTKSKIDKINNKNDLSNYLVENGLNLKIKQEWLFSKYVDVKKEKTTIFTFKSDGSGSLLNMEDKSEMIFVWKALSKNTFDWKHPKSQYDPTIMTIDFENDLVSSEFYSGEVKNKYEILYNDNVSQVKQVKKEMSDDKKVKEEYWKFLDDEFIQKDGKNSLRKIMKLIIPCAQGVKLQMDSLRVFTSIKKDIENWLYRAEASLRDNNIREMRITRYHLRDHAFQAYSISASKMGTNNLIAQNCLSIYNDWKINHTKLEVWKKNYLSN